MVTRIARAALAALVVVPALLACGTDVDLGGASDAAAIDAGPPGAECAPCAAGNDCASGTCGQFAGDLYCGSACSSSSQCAASETCNAVTSTSGSSVRVCVPTSDACSPAAPPSDNDGATLDHCGSLNGPPIASSCAACGKYSNDCQPNGCYGGYWCDEATRDCQPPPKTCP